MRSMCSTQGCEIFPGAAWRCAVRLTALQSRAPAFSARCERAPVYHCTPAGESDRAIDAPALATLLGSHGERLVHHGRVRTRLAV